jgi:hypothetical protein
MFPKPIAVLAAAKIKPHLDEKESFDELIWQFSYVFYLVV